MKRVFCFGLLVAFTAWSCTKQVSVGHLDPEKLDGSGDRTYRIEMKTGTTYVVREFVLTQDRMKITKVASMPGMHDTDGVADPEPVFWINVDEIVAIDEVMLDKVATGVSMTLILVGALALVVVVSLASFFASFN